MTNASSTPQTGPAAKGQVYAKIGVYCGLIAPMHWHAPYNYWQWPWERHSKVGSDHSLHNVENPIWVDPKTTDPTRATGVTLYKASAAEKARYAKALKTPEKAIVDGYKAYIKAKKSGIPAGPTASDINEAQAQAAGLRE
jgi:hypothetical protein